MSLETGPHRPWGPFQPSECEKPSAMPVAPRPSGRHALAVRATIPQDSVLIARKAPDTAPSLGSAMTEPPPPGDGPSAAAFAETPHRKAPLEPSMPRPSRPLDPAPEAPRDADTRARVPAVSHRLQTTVALRDDGRSDAVHETSSAFPAP
jgi:hypothetical protein